MTEAMMLGVAASFLAGSFGYILFQFWLKPMLKYRRIKRRVLAALADAARRKASTAGAATQDAADGRTAGQEALRRLAADLNTCYSEQLPDWYQLLLRKRREDPQEAAGALMKLAGTRHPGPAERQLETVRRALNLPRSDGRP